MLSGILISTAVASLLGLLLNVVVLYLVFSRRSRPYHLLFSAVVLICAIWDLGIFLIVIRNNHPQEIEFYGYIVTLPCILLPAIIFNFTESYLRLSHTVVVRLLWAISILALALMALGVPWPIEGIYEYSWGNIFRVASPSIAVLIPISLFALAVTVSCWQLYRAYRANPESLASRHAFYMLVGFAAIGLAILKVLVIYGINTPLLLLIGMILNDIFAAVIGIAIVKQRLFDITIILKKSALYSAIAAIVFFVFSLSEHTLASYLGDLIGERMQIPYLISVAISIAILLPLYRRLEHMIDRYFKDRRFDF
jgi:hypothetical protein